MTRLVFLDTETTGLDPTRHEVWEVAWIVRDPDSLSDREEHRFLFTEALEKADPGALRVGRYYERHPYPYGIRPVMDWDLVPPAHETASKLAEDLRGAVLCGFNPAFDDRFLTALLAEYNLAPTWHYRTVDVTTMAGAVLNRDIPWNTNELLAELGVVVSEHDRHTALGDARAARDLFDELPLGR